MFTVATFVLVLVCSLFWSGYDLTRKLLVDRMRPTPLLFVLTAGQAPLLAAWATVEGWGALGPGYAAPALGSIALNVIANVAFIHAFKIAPISVTIPLLSLTPVFTALFAIPLLGELPSAVQGLGIALVVAGAFLINLREGPPPGAPEATPGTAPVTAGAVVRALRRERGALLMVVVALSWSLASPLDKLALAAASPPVHGFVLCAGVGAAVFVLLAAEGRVGAVREIGRAPWVFVLALVLSAIALALQLLAYAVVWVSLVETVKRGFGNVAALAYGHWLLGEAVTARKVVGVTMITAGVALVSV